MSVKKFPTLTESSRSSQKRAVPVGPGATRSDRRRYKRQGGLVTPGKPVERLPPAPPNQMLIDIVRTRGVRRPANGPLEGITLDRSAGHLKIPADLQYGQSGLTWIS